MITLKSLGWNSFFQNQFNQLSEQDFIKGRITVEHKERYRLLTEKGDISGEVSGKFLFNSQSPSSFPKTGDWVAGIMFEEENKMIINHLFERQTRFSRKAAGRKTEEQVLASNIDYLFIVQSLNADLSIGRLERYTAMAYEGKIKPVLILSKTDLQDDYSKIVLEIGNAFPSMKIFPVSSLNNSGIEELHSFIREGKTYAFAGSSGVGKSTIINKLLGEDRQAVQDIREWDSLGRHTTTRRELILLPQGGILIDTPGMRELQLWNSEEGLSETFSEIDAAAEHCRYSDCTHTIENGCEVLTAVAEGRITREKYDGYLKLQKELKYLEQRQNILSALDEKKKWKNIHKEVRRFYKNSDKYKD